jgi:hypothetical protein
MSDLERAYEKAGVILLYLAREVSFGDVSMRPTERAVSFSWKCTIDGKKYHSERRWDLTDLSRKIATPQTIAKWTVSEWKQLLPAEVRT